MTDAVVRQIEDEDAEWLKGWNLNLYRHIEKNIREGFRLETLEEKIRGWSWGHSSYRDKCVNAARSLWRREQAAKTKPLKEAR